MYGSFSASANVLLGAAECGGEIGCGKPLLVLDVEAVGTNGEGVLGVGLVLKTS